MPRLAIIWVAIIWVAIIWVEDKVEDKVEIKAKDKVYIEISILKDSPYLPMILILTVH
jgi:hypothetical protein